MARSKVKSRSHHDVAHLHHLTNIPTKYQLPTPYSFWDTGRTNISRRLPTRPSGHHGWKQYPNSPQGLWGKKSKRFQITRQTRKGGTVRKNATRGQPEASVNTKRLFFLDVGRGMQPPKISIQFHMVSYCSAIKVHIFTQGTYVSLSKTNLYYSETLYFMCI